MIDTSTIRVRNIIERKSNDLVGTPNNIFLVGFMASGKSHVGRQLAKRTGWKLLDADSVIIERAGMSIEEIFKIEGEVFFRSLESEIVSELCSGSRQIVAMGGGAFLNPANREQMLNHGSVVCLRAKPETIFKRLNKSQSNDRGRRNTPVRPLLGQNDPLEKIESLIQERSVAYSEAHYQVDTDEFGPDEIAVQILHLLGNGSG